MKEYIDIVILVVFVLPITLSSVYYFSQSFTKKTKMKKFIGVLIVVIPYIIGVGFTYYFKFNG